MYKINKKNCTNSIERFSNIAGMFVITCSFSPRQSQMTFLMCNCLMKIGAGRRVKGKRGRLEIRIMISHALVALPQRRACECVACCLSLHLPAG